MQRNRGKQQNGKTRDLFKKIGDTKGTFHTKMGTIKDRAGMLHIINLRTHDVSDWESDDLNEYLEVDSIRQWEEAHCQIRMVMYLCSMCHLYKNNLKCERRDIIEGKVQFPLQIVKLADYVKTEE